MKTSLRRASKRTLALLLGVLMLITTAGIGTLFTANAVTNATTTYYLWYSIGNSNEDPSTYTNKIQLQLSSDGSYYTGEYTVGTSGENVQSRFLINESSTSHDSSVIKSSVSLQKGNDLNWLQTANRKAGNGDYIETCQFEVKNAGKVYIGYNPAGNGTIIVSTNKSDIPGYGTGGGGTGGGGGTTTQKYYLKGDKYSNWDDAKEMTQDSSNKKLYYFEVNSDCVPLNFKITDNTNWFYTIDTTTRENGVTLTNNTSDNNNVVLKEAATVYFNSENGGKIYAIKKTEPTSPTTPVTNEYTVGVATNYSNATVTATVSGKSVSTTTSTFATIDKVKEGSEVTFTAKASDNNKEFKGWFTTLDPNTKQNNGGTSPHEREKGYNAVSMDETFTIESLRSNVKIYALYSDEQDEDKGGIVSGAIYYYSAPTVNLDIKNKDGNSITKASIGDTITLEAKIPSDGESVYYKNRFKQSTQLQYLYNFYEIENDGSKHLLDSQTGNATKAVEDQRLICTTETTFSETSRYIAEAYCVYVDPEETPFSVGVSDEKTVKSDTEINTDTITVYVDFDNYEFTNPSSAKIVVTDADDIEKAYSLTKLGSDSSSNIYYADNVVVAYTTKDDVNTMKSDFVSINVDGQQVFIDDEDQPELSSLLEHNILWYRANTKDLTTNVEQSHYVAGQKTYSHENDTLKFRASTSRTQSNELSTKRIYLTNNRGDNSSLKQWKVENTYLVYTLDKSLNVAMYDPNTGAPKSGYSEKDVVWFSTQMKSGGKNTVGDGQELWYADIPFNATSYYFEDSTSGSTDKAEITYLTDKRQDGTTDRTYVVNNGDEVNGYYFLTSGDNAGKVRMWPGENGKNDWPKTPTITQHKSEIYIVKDQSVNIVPQTSDASLGVKYSSDDSNTASVSVSSSSYTTSKTVTVTGKKAGTANITLTPRGVANKVNIDGVSETIKVTVINKDELKQWIAEAEYIIKERNEGRLSDYTKNSYAAFQDVYNVAIDVYNRSLYNQTEVDTYAALLKEAMNNIRTESKVRPEDNQFDRIGYNTSDVKVISDGNGKVNRPTITDERIKPYIADVKDGEDKNIGYEIIYAEGFGFSCTAQEEKSKFLAWTRNGDKVTEDKTLTIENALPRESEYIAKFDEPVYKLTLNYQFKDFDVKKAGTNEYTENGLSDKFSTYKLETSITIKEAEDAMIALNSGDVSGTKVTELSKECTPDVVSSYYTYYYPNEIEIDKNYQLSIDEGNKTAELTITLDQQPRKYTITVNGNVVGSDYHYQQQVVLDAEEILGETYPENQKFKWLLVDNNEMGISTVAEEGNENILSLQKKYTVRALEDGMSYNVSPANDGDTIDKTSVISPAYTEIIYNNDNEKRIQQNFYIQDNLENSGDLQAAGNIFYYWNKTTNQPVDTSLKKYYKDHKTLFDYESNQLRDLIKANYQTWESKAKTTSNKDTGTIKDSSGKNIGLTYTYYFKPETQGLADGLLRYSSANQCWSYIFAVNSADNYEKYKNFSYRVHSFFILKNGSEDERVIVSKTYAQADVYVDTTDYRN